MNKDMMKLSSGFTAETLYDEADITESMRTLFPIYLFNVYYTWKQSPSIPSFTIDKCVIFHDNQAGDSVPIFRITDRDMKVSYVDPLRMNLPQNVFLEYYETVKDYPLYEECRSMLKIGQKMYNASFSQIYSYTITDIRITFGIRSSTINVALTQENGRIWELRFVGVKDGKPFLNGGLKGVDTSFENIKQRLLEALRTKVKNRKAELMAEKQKFIETYNLKEEGFL